LIFTNQKSAKGKKVKIPLLYRERMKIFGFSIYSGNTSNTKRNQQPFDEVGIELSFLFN